jgi:hypothetical protein
MSPSTIALSEHSNLAAAAAPQIFLEEMYPPHWYNTGTSVDFVQGLVNPRPFAIVILRYSCGTVVTVDAAYPRNLLVGRYFNIFNAAGILKGRSVAETVYNQLEVGAAAETWLKTRVAGSQLDVTMDHDSRISGSIFMIRRVHDYPSSGSTNYLAGDDA